MSSRFDIFISYKREERELADAYSRAFQKAGYSVVTDLNIQKAVDFGEAIDQMISQSAMVVVLWTSASVTSNWVRKEAAEAERRDKYFGVVVELVSPEDLPLAVRNNHFTDVSRLTRAMAMASVVEEIGNKIGSLRDSAVEAEAKSAQLSGDLEFYQVVDEIGQLPGYHRYLNIYPSGIYIDNAREKILKLNHWTYRLREWLPNAAWIGAIAAMLAVFLAYLNTPPDQEEISFLRLQAEKATKLEKSIGVLTEERNMAAHSAETRRKKIADLNKRLVKINTEYSAKLQDITRQRDQAQADARAKIAAKDKLAEVSPAALNYFRCKISGKRGIKVYGKCYSVDTTKLDLRSTKISDAAPLAGLTNLTLLDLGGTLISDATPLAGLTKLTTLYLRGTKIRDLTPLRRLKALHFLVTPDGFKIGDLYNDTPENRRAVQEFFGR